MRRRLCSSRPSRCSRSPTIVAFARGGYFDAARLRAGIAACLLAALAVAVAERPLPRRWPGASRSAAWRRSLGWSALSLTWAPLAGPAVDDVERIALYLAAFVAAAALLTGRADLDRAGAAGGHRVDGGLRPVRAAAAGRVLARALARGRRSPGAAADLLERPGRLGGARPALAAGLVAAGGRDALPPRPRPPWPR